MSVLKKIFSTKSQPAKSVVEAIEILRSSHLLDPVWYRQTHPDLIHAPIDVARHYLEYGANEGRNPGPNFDTKFYLSQNPDVAAARINPLLHYILHGLDEGRLPVPDSPSRSSPRLTAEAYLPSADALFLARNATGEARTQASTVLTEMKHQGANPNSETLFEEQKTIAEIFDAEFYIALYSDAASDEVTPFEHYNEVGRNKFYHPAFDELWYRAEYPDIEDFSGSLKEHFLLKGRLEGRHPAFHHDWYRNEYAHLLKDGISPLEHYRKFGRREGLHAGFDRNFYLDEYRDIANAGVDPFEHYDKHGRQERRNPAFNRHWYKLAYPDIANSDIDPFTHYVIAGRAENRPISFTDLMIISEWGRPNLKEGPSVPWSLSGRVPRSDPQYTPLVSVIVPNFNHAPYLRERLESIYSQNYTNIEVILLDDNSSDKSVDILREYAGRYPEITQCVFNEKNSGGVFHQWKRGLKLAKGELIWIAESDDYCSSEFLTELVRFFRNSGVMLAFSRTDFITGTPAQNVWTSEAYWAEVNFSLGTEPVIAPAQDLVNTAWGARNIIANVSSVLFRNPGDVAILDDETWQNLRICGDWVFYLSLIRGGLVGYSPNVTNFYRQHPSNTSISTHDKDVYYEEHFVVASYLAKLFKVNDNVFDRHRDVLYSHWVMKRGPDRNAEFDALFDIDRIRQLQFERKPNIALALYAFVTGGGETFPILMANLLHARGYSVSIVNFEAEAPNPGIRASLSRAIPVIEPENTNLAARALAKLGVEIVHSHHTWVDISLSKGLKGVDDIKHVVTTHGLYEFIGDVTIRAHESDLQNVDAFVFIADKNLSPFSREFKHKSLFKKITNTVALNPLSNLRRKDIGLSEEDFVICLASRAVVEKGWPEAIESVLLANEGSERNIVLLLIGDGPEYQRLSFEKLPDRVRLLGFQKNPRDYFAISDLGLIASKFKGESCPLVLIECLTVGKPVVSSDIGEVSNMLMSPTGLAGVPFALDDWKVNVPRLAEIIRNLANDRDAYNQVLRNVPGAATKFDQDTVLSQYVDVYSHVLKASERGLDLKIKLSVVLVCYNMARELPRTIQTLAPDVQKIDVSEYEVIVVDNGSKCAYDVARLRQICPNIQFVQYDHPKPSPVDALNYGISLARGKIICVCIDAARMASPGLLRTGLNACEADDRVVAGSFSFHLGAEPQNVSINKGYRQVVEDDLLASVDWMRNGYELFNISSLDPSSRFGLYSCPAETNSLFMTRERWKKFGGFPSDFVGPGGGLVNLDVWRRLCEDDDNIIVMLLGEGTFHQVHGGVATNAVKDVWSELHTEYIRIRGYEFQMPKRKTLFFGEVNPWFVDFFRHSHKRDQDD